MIYKLYYNNVMAPEYFEFNGNKKDLRQYALTLFDAKDEDVEKIARMSKAHIEVMLSHPHAPHFLREDTALLNN